jgi:ubiquinone/menaquinone biosynthesis C-methylase UbiE
MRFGDFTGLAADYARFRQAYAPDVAEAILNYTGRDPANIVAADIGAGTGIWTRMLVERGLHSVVAVEPNDDMRAQGIEDSRSMQIVWRKGSAEETDLPSSSFHLVSMASSLHWTDFDKACEEFNRILKPRGVFAALWNSRVVEENPLLAEIEAQIAKLRPDIRRVSSGRSGVVERLMDRLRAKPQFREMVYLEGRHSVRQTPEEYIGAWHSVNDLRVQLGNEMFRRFLDFAKERVAGVPAIETTYVTRAWAARRAR